MSVTKSRRSNYVGDAIECDAEGVNFGQYHEYVLKPACQPIYRNSRDGFLRLDAYEGLIRPEENGLPISPCQFFGDLVQSDHLFIEMLCTALHIRSYQQAQDNGISLFLNVNVANFDTVENLEREVYFTLDRLARHGLGNHNLVVEIVETEVMDHKILHRVCEIMRENEIRFALDDFGTKASNIERYLDLQPDIVKIDRSLFRDFVVNREACNFIGSVIQAFRDNGCQVLLEGLESPEEVNLAVELESDLLQGFSLGRPEHVPCQFVDSISLQEFDQEVKVRSFG